MTTWRAYAFRAAEHRAQSNEYFRVNKVRRWSSSWLHSAAPSSDAASIAAAETGYGSAKGEEFKRASISELTIRSRALRRRAVSELRCAIHSLPLSSPEARTPREEFVSQCQHLLFRAEGR
jgi:hypothetical protein